MNRRFSPEGRQDRISERVAGGCKFRAARLVLVRSLYYPIPSHPIHYLNLNHLASRSPTVGHAALASGTPARLPGSRRLTGAPGRPTVRPGRFQAFIQKHVHRKLQSSVADLDDEARRKQRERTRNREFGLGTPARVSLLGGESKWCSWTAGVTILDG